MRERRPAPGPASTPAGAVETLSSRLQGFYEPRDRLEAAHAATAMLLLSGAVTGLFAIVEPSVGNGINTFVNFAVPAALVVLGVLTRRATGGPSVMWAAAPTLGVVLTAALDLASNDASAAGQVFFCFPVLYAASQLRPPAAFTVMSLALASEAVVALSLLSPFRALTDIVYVGVTLATMAVLLVRGGKRQDRLTAELRRQAAIDPLTGLVTRRVLDEAAEAALASAKGDGGTVLILADVDHFKAINDGFGHPVGDAALIHLARTLAAHSRPQDIVSRLGGDEMALLLTGCSADAGLARAEAVALAVRQTPFDSDAGPITMSVSVGVAHAPSSAIDLRTLYIQADSMLYEAKRHGRGRVGRGSALGPPADRRRGEPFTARRRPTPVIGAGRRAVAAAVRGLPVLGVPVLGAGVLAAAVAGCGQAVVAGPGSATHQAATRAPERPRAASSRPASPRPASPLPASSSPRGRAAFVVITVTKTAVVAGNIYFAPPPAGAVPKISPATAFALARRVWGDPQGTAIPEVVLTSLTNDGQGQMLPDGGIRRFDVNRLVWAVIDSGATCTSSGPAGAPHPTFHDCVYISFVDVRIGQARGSMDGGGPGVSAPVFGSSSFAQPSSSPVSRKES